MDLKINNDVTERHLLVVDDDLMILHMMEDVLSDEGYFIHKASNGYEGLEVLQHRTICVVLSDYQMPLMTGIAFLSQVKELYPDTVRLITSSTPDHDIFNEAIRDEVIYKFLPKLVGLDQLRMCVYEAFQRYEQES